MIQKSYKAGTGSFLHQQDHQGMATSLFLAMFEHGASWLPTSHDYTTKRHRKYKFAMNLAYSN